MNPKETFVLSQCPSTYILMYMPNQFDFGVSANPKGLFLFAISLKFISTTKIVKKSQCNNFGTTLVQHFRYFNPNIYNPPFLFY